MTISTAAGSCSEDSGSGGYGYLPASAGGQIPPLPEIPGHGSEAVDVDIFWRWNNYKTAAAAPRGTSREGSHRGPSKNIFRICRVLFFDDNFRQVRPDTQNSVSMNVVSR
eukprot:5292122-Pyramimonas_sp.AAC.1